MKQKRIAHCASVISYPYIAFIAMLMVLFAGCHHNSGGGSNDPQVTVTVDPSNGATDILLDTVVSATFSETMDSATINGTTFTLGDSTGAALSGTVTFDDVNNVATFTPDSSLGLFRTYTATLTADITSLSGIVITQHNWSFATLDGTWGTAESIQATDLIPNTFPKVAFDGDSNAIAVWIEDNSIFANEYTIATAAWGTAT
ncbi:MAG: Ig-like domain-containing protein, partial [Gammaproteobacteria bacterium]